MFYYRIDDDTVMMSTSQRSGFTQITQQEYEDAMSKAGPTEEEIRAEKEAELTRLLRELYPEEYREED